MNHYLPNNGCYLLNRSWIYYATHNPLQCRNVAAEYIFSRCNKPLEVCFLLNETGEHSIAKGRARPVSLSEATDMLRKADEYGLIHLTPYQPDHEIYALCNCCSCCCHDLHYTTVGIWWFALNMSHAKTPDDVMAVDGRITIISGMPRAAGRVRIGASNHMARLIIRLMQTDPSVRAGIDFANPPGFSDWLSGYCRKNGWALAMIDRRDEPGEVRNAEGSSMQWKAQEAVRAAGGGRYRRLSATPEDREKSRSVPLRGMNPSALCGMCAGLHGPMHNR